MKKQFVAFLSTLFLTPFITATSQSMVAVDEFSDIQFWVGSGANEAALIIDWQDGKSPETLAWGYRWDGAATGMDMLNAIAAADTRLEAFYDPSQPTFLYGLGYDLDGDGGGFTVTPPGDETGFANDSDDHYQEGLFGGFWSYWLNSASGPGDNPYMGGDWEISGVGISNRNLFDGAWDGWIYDADGFPSTTNPGPPGLPIAAVPEVNTSTLLLMGLLGVSVFIHYQRKKKRERKTSSLTSFS